VEVGVVVVGMSSLICDATHTQPQAAQFEPWPGFKKKKNKQKFIFF